MTRTTLPTRPEYLGLIISEHRSKPKFAATVETTVGPVVDLAAFLDGLPEDFDLDTAIGAQLDVVGEWIGQSRVVQIPLVDVWFSFGTEGLGWGQGVWKGPYDPTTGLYSLDDEVYRSLLRAKIEANNWDGTAETAAAGLTRFIGTEAMLFVEFSQDMSMDIGIAGAIPSTLLLTLIAEGYVPFKPAGVAVRYYVTSIPSTPIFGFGADSDFVAGFGTGAVGIPIKRYLGI